MDKEKDCMNKVKIAAFSVSLDGFGSGPRQDLQNPLRVRGVEPHPGLWTRMSSRK
jgi:hypothetical protein